MLPVFQNLRWSIQGFVKGEELFSNCYLTSSEALFTFICRKKTNKLICTFFWLVEQYKCVIWFDKKRFREKVTKWPAKFISFYKSLVSSLSLYVTINMKSKIERPWEGRKIGSRIRPKIQRVLARNLGRESDHTPLWINGRKWATNWT